MEQCATVCVYAQALVAFVPHLHTPSLSFSFSLSIYLLHCIPHTFLIRPLAFKGVHDVCH